jgi:hypothetical protein
VPCGGTQPSRALGPAACAVDNSSAHFLFGLAFCLVCLTGMSCKALIVCDTCPVLDPSIFRVFAPVTFSLALFSRCQINFLNVEFNTSPRDSRHGAWAIEQRNARLSQPAALMAP